MDEKTIAHAVLLLVRDKNLSKKFVFMNIMSKQGFDDFISGHTRISFFLLYQLLERMNVSLSEFDEILTYCNNQCTQACPNENEAGHVCSTNPIDTQELQNRLFECGAYHQYEIGQLHHALSQLDDSFIYQVMVPTLVSELKIGCFGVALKRDVMSLIIDTIDLLITQGEYEHARFVFMLVQTPLVACLNKFSTRVLSRICTFSKMLTVICPSTN